MQQYRTVLHENKDEFIERRSRFIGYVKPVTEEEDAIQYINEIKSKHWDATHNVYAYILRKNNIQRYSDDGEPQALPAYRFWMCSVRRRSRIALLWLRAISAAFFSAAGAWFARIPMVQKSHWTRAEL